MVGERARERLRDLGRRVHPLQLGALHSASVDELSEELAVAAARPPTHANAAAALHSAERLRTALLEAVEADGPRAVDELARGEPSRAATRRLLCDAGEKVLCERRGKQRRKSTKSTAFFTPNTTDTNEFYV